LLAGDVRGRLLVWGDDWQGKDAVTLPTAILEDENAAAVTALRMAPQALFSNLALSGHADGTVRLWDLQNKKLLVTLLAIPKPKAPQPRVLNLEAPEGPAVTVEDFDWVNWTTDGLYSASAGGQALLRWREGEAVIAAPQSATEQRREDILPRALQSLRANDPLLAR